MSELILNIYDENGNIIKTATANLIDLEFGTILAIMALLNVDDIDNTSELLKVVAGAWNEVTLIMRQIFPELEESDFKHVKIKELLPIIVLILKDSFASLLDIPSDSKN